MGMMEQLAGRHKNTKELVPYIFPGEILDRKKHSQELVKPDDRFAKLLGNSDWMRLPAPIRKRFGKRLKQGESVAYQGVVTDMKMSKLGWLFAQAARLIGAPLPYDRNSVNQPAVVIVTEDVQTNGQFWIRQYGRPEGFPQMVHSSKRFAGATGLEEYIGYGIGMALKLDATPHALFFKSDHYFVQLFSKRFRLPKWLAPFNLKIGHHELGDNRFVFTLELSSSVFGKMISQDAVFMDPVER